MKVTDIYLVKKDDYNNYKMNNPFSYTSDKFSIIVNDYPLNETTDYTITDNILVFNNPLSIGDKIQLEYSISDSVKIVTRNSYSRDSLYKIFSSNAKFKLNHTYDFILKVQGELFSNKFNTKHDPFFTTVKKIRLDTGDILNGATDFQISQIIYMYSKEVQDILGVGSAVPVSATNVVRYKTDIDLCWAIYCSISGKYGKIEKKVGTIEILKETKLPLIEAMVKRFKDLLKPNEENLNGSSLTAASFVKAGSKAYTVPNRGVF